MQGKSKLKLVGNLGKLSVDKGEPEKRVSELDLLAPQRLGDMIEEVQREYSLSLRRENILILVNGTEANALSDLDTMINPGDEVVLVPMFHGGL